MAVLPAAGAPLMAFTLSAGEAFGAQLSMAGVIVLALTMIALNLALTYWLARYALRPLLTNLVTRYGYKIPSITKKNALSVALVVRLTPGPPFFLQGYILGLAEVPFRLYMMVSWLCVMPWAVGAIVMGQGILNGNFKVAATGLGLIVVAVVIVLDDDEEQLVGEALDPADQLRGAFLHARQEQRLLRRTQQHGQPRLQRLPAREEVLAAGPAVIAPRRRIAQLVEVDEHAAVEQRLAHLVVGHHLALGEQQLAFCIPH
eukprot:gene4859-6078_t